MQISPNKSEDKTRVLTPRGDERHEQVMVSVPMPLEKARQEEWEILYGPNTGARGRMGDLLDANQLDIINLAYIIKRGPRPTKAAAALTLLTYELGRPQTVASALRYGPRVVGRSTYLEEQQYDSMMMGVFYGFIGLLVPAAFILFLAWTTIERIIGGQPWPLTVGAALLSIVIFVPPVGLYARRKFNQEITKFRNYRKAREGEEWVTDAIRASLDSNWTAFRNVKLPGRKGDMDVVLVGPPGVWALEIKSYHCPVRVRDKKWERLAGKKWRSLEGDPIAQVRKNAQQLRYHLEQFGVVGRVQAAVVLTQPQAVSNFDPTDEPVWKQFEVEEQLRQLNTLPGALPARERERIERALGLLVENVRSSAAENG